MHKQKDGCQLWQKLLIDKSSCPKFVIYMQEFYELRNKFKFVCLYLDQFRVYFSEFSLQVLILLILFLQYYPSVIHLTLKRQCSLFHFLRVKKYFT